MDHVLAISGGVGGAKLALGLQHVLPPGALTLVVNTGDDFEYLGLSISPDLDTILYTLAGLAAAETGWGRDQETWSFMAEIERLGGESWFRLGDRDLAVHVERTRRLAAGESLDAVTRSFARSFGITTYLVPMSNDRVRTVLETDEGALSFQDYFVRRRCVPRVTAIHYEGSGHARPVSGVLDALVAGRYETIVICPSNPYLSIDPILAIPAWRDALRCAAVPIVAVSPLISGAAVKGPAAKIMRELGLEVSPVTVARHYGDLLDGFVVDATDAPCSRRLASPVHVTHTLMRTTADKARLAREVLEFSVSCSRAIRRNAS